MGDIDLNPFRRRLLKRGESAAARVLEADISGNQSPGAFLTHKYVLEVQPAGAPPFQVKVKDAFNVFWAPKRGDLLKVKFDGKSHKTAFDLKGDPRYDSEMQKQPGQWSVGEAPPPTILRRAPASAPGNGAARLQQLAQLRDRGLISPEEYEAQRVRILGSL